MTSPHLRKLGLVGAGSALVLIAGALAPQSALADPTPTTGSAVTVTKSMPAGPVANGSSVVATLTVDNTTLSPIANVVIQDYYDYGLTVTATSNPNCVDSPPTSTTLGIVTCTWLSLAPGPVNRTITFTANYVGPTVYSFWRKSHERMEIQKAEGHISLLEDEQKIVRAQCETGYHIMDFGFVKQHVDQDEGDYEHIRVVTTDVVDSRTYEVTVKNKSTGQAQAKLYATCIKDTTNDATTLSFDPLQEVNVTLHPQQPGKARPLYAYCAPGKTPIAVDVRAVKDSGHATGSAYSDGLIVQHGLEADGGQRTRVWVEVLEPADVTLEWQCMATTTSSGRPMQFELVTGSKTVPAGAKKRKKLECNVGFKGIVAGWEGGKINGTEPQPIARVFWFYNQSGASKTYDLSLLCLRNRLLKTNRLEIDDTVKEKLLNYASGVEDPAGAPKWIAPSQKTVKVEY